uniref:Uncharacterized protein n=1 Tax=Arundo donax TaxID=35708 RepID=A0A0A9HQ51_ARUDO
MQGSPGCDEPEVEHRRSSRQEPGQERHHGRQLVSPTEPRGTLCFMELEEEVDDRGARTGSCKREYRQDPVTHSNDDHDARHPKRASRRRCSRRTRRRRT